MRGLCESYSAAVWGRRVSPRLAPQDQRTVIADRLTPPASPLSHRLPLSAISCHRLSPCAKTCRALPRWRDCCSRKCLEANTVGVLVRRSMWLWRPMLARKRLTLTRRVSSAWSPEKGGGTAIEACHRLPHRHDGLYLPMFFTRMALAVGATGPLPISIWERRGLTDFGKPMRIDQRHGPDEDAKTRGTRFGF